MPIETNTKERDPYNVPAVNQAARLLQCMAQHDGTHMSLTEICARTGLHNSRAFSLLHTLQKFNLIQRNIGGKGYSLGLGLVGLSRKVLDDLNIPRLAEPFLKNLAVAADSTSVLGLIINEDEIMVVGKYEGGRDVGVTVRVGRRLPISHSAEGKAIAAFLPSHALKRILQQDMLHYYGNNQHFNRKRLKAELAQCRKQGYALDLEDVKQGLNAVAAPLLGHKGLPIGYIGILGLLSADKARQLGPDVSEAARKLSQQLGAKME
jgi:DNA-binding IclR family transcriptional regulator